jgi:hypothetical protein
MAEMLWAAGSQKRTIQDLGGWAVSKRDAVDCYFSTKPHQRLRILSELQLRLERKGGAGERHGAAGQGSGARRARDDLDSTHFRGQRQ